jgi:hypothetical protein
MPEWLEISLGELSLQALAELPKRLPQQGSLAIKIFKFSSLQPKIQSMARKARSNWLRGA